MEVPTGGNFFDCDRGAFLLESVVFMTNGITTFLGRLFGARRISKATFVGRIDDGCGLHRFASRRDQAVSDCRCVGLLAEALQAQRGRDPDRGARDSLRALREAATAADRWVDESRISLFGDLVSKRTGESAVYWNSGESVFYKVKNPEAKRPLKRTGDNDWVYEHVIHNILFPEASYEFVGIGEETGELRVVLRQRAVLTETFPTRRQIVRALAERGLRREDRYFFGDSVVSVTDVGEHGDNVLLGDNGVVYFVDPLIRLHRPAPDVIEFLTGFNPEKPSL